MNSAQRFVGREREFQVLSTALEAARDGRGSVALVTGEPGIGKTRLVRELAEQARSTGAIVLWGRCIEAAGAPPYWPWAQALETLVRAASTEPHGAALGGVGGLRALLGEAASVVASVAPAIAGGEHVEPPPATADAASARFQLFVAVERLLRSVAEVAPIVVVLDDLQWADRSSLGLLELIATGLADQPVLLVATCRRNERAPIADTLASVARSEGYLAVDLEGIDATEVAQYVEGELGSPAPPELISALSARTRGNPFFLREIVGAMVANGSTSALPPELPASVREALGSRLAQLSEDGHDLLRRLALLGRSVDPPLLAAITGRRRTRAIELAEEAVDANLLEVTGPHAEYRFVHDLTREALLAELGAAQRGVMHAEIAAAIEATVAADPEADPRVGDLAQHFVSAAALDPAYADRAVHYSELAGRRAEEVWAWADAIQHYRDALEWVREAADEPEREAALLIALGRAMRDNRDPQALATLTQAVDRYRQHGNGRGLGRAVVTMQLLLPRTEDGRALVREALAADDGSDPLLTAELLMRLAREWEGSEADAAAEQAERLADAHGATQVKGELVFRRALYAFTNDGLDAAMPLFDEANRWTIAAGDQRREYVVMGTLARLLLQAGRVAAATEQLEPVRELVRARRDASGAAAAWLFHDDSYLRFLHGDLSVATPAQERGSLPWQAAMHRALRLEVGGDVGGANVLAQGAGDQPVQGLAVVSWGLRARLKWRAEGAVAARTDLEHWREALDRGGPRYTRHEANAYSALGDALLALGDEELIARAYDDLNAIPEVRLAPFVLGGALDQLRGAIALHLGQVDDAEHWHRAGAEWATEADCPVVLGRNLAGLAEVAERRGQRSQAIGHLEQAIVRFEAHDATLWLNESQGRLAELRDAPNVGRPSYPAGLTPQEVKVIRLIAANRSNQEIADALVIAIGTVRRHVSHILEKTGARNRMAAAEFARKHGLAE